MNLYRYKLGVDTVGPSYNTKTTNLFEADNSIFFFLIGSYLVDTLGYKKEKRGVL